MNHLFFHNWINLNLNGFRHILNRRILYRLETSIHLFKGFGRYVLRLGPQQPSGRRHAQQNGDEDSRKEAFSVLEPLQHLLCVAEAPFAVGLRALAHDATVTVREKLLENNAESVYVSATVQRHVAGHLLRGGVLVGARRLFQDAVPVGVGQPEIDDFHVVTIVGNQDVVGFQVTMNNLFTVEISHCREYLIHDFHPQVPRRVLGQGLLERAAIHIFHHDAGPHYRVVFLAEGVRDVGMVQLHPQFELLGQQTSIDLLALEFRLEPFQHEPLAVPLRFEEPVEAVGRDFRIRGKHIRDFLERGGYDSGCGRLLR